MALYYSFRELIANFANMWKLLLYRLIVLVICVSILIGVALPTLTYIIDEIAATGFFSNFMQFMTDMLGGSVNISSFGEVLKDNLISIGYILVENIGTLIITYVYVILVLCLSRFLNCIADFAVSDVINSNMAAGMRVGFMSSIFSNLGRAVKFSLAKVMFTVPFDALITLLLVVMFVSLFSPLGFFMPILVLLTAILLFAFRMTLFSGWMPAMITDGATVFGGLKEGTKAVFRRFWSVFSAWVIMLVLLVMFSGMLLLFTLGIGIIVIIPLYAVLYCAFYLVLHYESDGKRYYVDHETIVTPKSLFRADMESGEKLNDGVFYDRSFISDDEIDDEK